MVRETANLLNYTIKGNSPVDVSAWSFSEGIDYNFPGGTIIPANDYLVIAANPEITSICFS